MTDQIEPKRDHCPWWDEELTDFKKKCFLKDLYLYVDQITSQMIPTLPLILIFLGSGLHPLGELCFVNLLNMLEVKLEIRLVDYRYNNYPNVFGVIDLIQHHSKNHCTLYSSLTEAMIDLDYQNNNCLLMGLNGLYNCIFEEKNNFSQFKEINLVLKVLKLAGHSIKHQNFVYNETCAISDLQDNFEILNRSYIERLSPKNITKLEYKYPDVLNIRELMEIRNETNYSLLNKKDISEMPNRRLKNELELLFANVERLFANEQIIIKIYFRKWENEQRQNNYQFRIEYDSNFRVTIQLTQNYPFVAPNVLVEHHLFAYSLIPYPNWKVGITIAEIIKQVKSKL